MLAIMIDDAHLMALDALRKLRLLLEDFTKNHNLILIAQPELLGRLALSVNEDIKSRVTYSATMPKFAPDDIETFIKDQLDRVALAHSTFTPGGHGTHRTLVRRRAAQHQEPVHWRHAQGRQRPNTHSRSQAGQPRAPAATLAQKGGHDRLAQRRHHEQQRLREARSTTRASGLFGVSGTSRSAVAVVGALGTTTVEAHLWDVSVGIRSNSYDVNSADNYDIKHELNKYRMSGSGIGAGRHASIRVHASRFPAA